MAGEFPQDALADVQQSKPPRSPKRRLVLRLFLILTIIALLLGIPLAIYGWHEAHDLRIRRLTLDFADLPPAFDGYKIAFAADFHVPRFRKFQRKSIEALARLDADILARGGDFQYSRSWNPKGGIAFIDELAKLAPHFPDGIVAAPGNHDRDALRAHLAKHPAIHYIGGASYIVKRNGAAIAFAGVERSGGLKPSRMARETNRAAAGIPGDIPFRVLIAHWPDYFPVAKGQFDLTLSGDTHGGQIRLPWLGAPIKKTKLPQRYAWGIVQEDGAMLYTTSGVGAQLPIRILCPPEIVLIELRKAAK